MRRKIGIHLTILLTIPKILHSQKYLSILTWKDQVFRKEDETRSLDSLTWYLQIKLYMHMNTFNTFLIAFL